MTPPPRPSAHAPACSAAPDWLLSRACSEARGPTSAAPSPQPTLNVLQAGSKDAGGSDWLRRARPSGLSAPAAVAAAITELPVVSARSRGPADRSAGRSLLRATAVVRSSPAPVSAPAPPTFPPALLFRRRGAARAFVLAAPPGDAQLLWALSLCSRRRCHDGLALPRPRVPTTPSSP